MIYPPLLLISGRTRRQRSFLHSVASELVADLALILGKIVNSRHYDRIYEEAAGNHCHDAHSGDKSGEQRDSLEALHKTEPVSREPCAASKNFTDGAHDDQCQCKSKSHANSVEGGIKDAVLAGEHLSTAQNDAVNNDQGQIQSKCRVKGRDKCLQQHLHDRDESCDNSDEAGNSYFIGNDVVQR